MELLSVPSASQGLSLDEPFLERVLHLAVSLVCEFPVPLLLLSLAAHLFTRWRGVEKSQTSSLNTRKSNLHSLNTRLFFEFATALPLLLLLLAAHPFTGWRGEEKSLTNSMARGTNNSNQHSLNAPTESDVKHRETNNLLAPSSSGAQHDNHNHNGDQGLNTSTTSTACSQQQPTVATNNARSTANHADQNRYGIESSFKKLGDGDQDFENAEVDYGDNVDNSFITYSSGPQTFNGAVVVGDAISDSFTNGKEPGAKGSQNFKGAKIYGRGRHIG